MECLSIEILCRHVDNELEPQTRQAVAAHLRTCESCTDRLRTLQEHDALLRGYVPRSTPLATQGPDCYSAETLSAYVNDLLASRQAEAVEHHLDTCDFCLSEVMAIHRTLDFLKGGALHTPPAHLVAAAQQAFAREGQESTVEKLGALVIQVAAHGLKFVEALLLPANVQLVVGGYPVSAAAFRSAPADTEAVALLDIRQTVHDLEFHYQALHEDGETVLLHLRIQKAGVPLVRSRVSLASNGRTLYSKMTSAGGEVEFPRIAAGDYTIRVPREKVETRFVLRSASETSPAG